MLSCFINEEGRVFSEKTPKTVEFRLNLKIRQERVFEDLVLSDWPLSFSPGIRHFGEARNYFEQRVGTPQKLMDFALEGNLSKIDLADLLIPEKRRVYLDVCARFEKVCPRASLETSEVWTMACVSIWVCLFIDPDNRIPVWKS